MRQLHKKVQFLQDWYDDDDDDDGRTFSDKSRKVSL